jgi:uncharacterized protein
MLYFDTSFLAPLFKPEASSLEIKRFMTELAPVQLAISSWTRVEFYSLLSKNVRMGLLPPVQADAAEAAFETFVARGCTMIDVARDDFNVAGHFLADRHSGLRAGDALHLAIASNHAIASIYSLDRIMIAVGRSLGLPMNIGFSTAG